ncbi:hypothetical protein H0H93_003313 [Arthromyces matolae]|nr:hypothetical protein H0H93_003313 [Arthromyces matolae]
MSTPLVPALRTGAFGTAIFCSAIVLALSAHVTNTTVTLLGGYFTFAAMGIATATLALLTLPVMYIVDTMRKGAVTSRIIVEVAWLGTLWILFMATAALASQATSANFGHTCRSRILFAYTVLLVSFSTALANRGYDKVWHQSVRETEFNAPPLNVAPAAPMAIPTQQYIPPQATGPYPPQGAPVAPYPPQGTPVAPYPPQGTPPPAGWAGTPQQVPVAYPAQA